MLLKWHKQGSAVIPTLEFWLINRPTLQGNLLDRYWTISNRVFEEGAPETFVLRNQDEVDWNIWNATLLRHRESSGLSCRLSLVAAAGASAVFPGRLCWPVTCCVLLRYPELPHSERGRQSGRTRWCFPDKTFSPHCSPKYLQRLLLRDVMCCWKQQKPWSGLADSWCDACVRPAPFLSLLHLLPFLPSKRTDAKVIAVTAQSSPQNVRSRRELKVWNSKNLDFLATSWNSNIGCMYFSDTKQLLQVKAFGCCFHIDMKTVENIGTWFHSGRNVAQKKMENLLSGWLWRQRYMSSWDIFLSIVAPLVDLFLWDFPKMWQSLGRIVAKNYVCYVI